MKVLLIGASGQLGSHLREVLPVNGHELLAMDSASLNVRFC